MFTKDWLASLRPEREMKIHQRQEQVKLRGNDNYGILTGSTSNDEKFLAVAAYVLDGSATEFRRHLVVAIELRIGLLRRHRSGTPLLREGDHMGPNCPPPDQAIWHGDVSNGKFQWMLYALAAARLDLAEELARLMGTVHTDPIGESYCQSIRFILLNQNEIARGHLEDLRIASPAKDNDEFYQMMMEITAVRPDPARVQELVRIMDRRHRHYARNEEPFLSGTEEELLCLWGIGLANLARYKRIVDRIEFSSELIPAELLV